MKQNKTAESQTIRELIENFEDDKLELTVFKERRKGSWQSVSYGQLRNKIRLLSRALTKTGLKKGDKAGLLAENRLEWAFCYLAATYMGAIIVPLDIFLSSKELRPLVKTVALDMIFCSRSRMKKISPFADEIKRIVCFDRIEKIHKNMLSPPELEENRHIDFATLLELGQKTSSKEEAALSNVEPDDTAALIFMRGEVFAELSHNNIVANGRAFIKTVEYPAFKEKLVAQLPLHHTYPSMFALIAPLLSYSEVTFIAGIKSKLVFETARAVKPNCIVVVPLALERIYLGFYEYLRQSVDFPDSYFSSYATVNQFFEKTAKDEKGKQLIKKIKEKLGLDHFKFFISGGAPLSGWLISGMKTLGVEVLQGFGLTEASPIVSCNTLKSNSTGSAGLPVEGVEVKIDKPNELGEGEILFKGPNVMLGYYKMPEKTRETVDSEGWLRTGDMAWIDDRGFIYITGRLKKVIVNKGGKNIYPEETEKKLRQNSYFEDAAVVSRANENGEYPHAVILLDKQAVLSAEKERGEKFSRENLDSFIKDESAKSLEGTASYKIPQSFETAESREELRAIKEKVWRIQTPPPLLTKDADKAAGSGSKAPASGSDAKSLP